MELERKKETKQISTAMKFSDLKQNADISDLQNQNEKDGYNRIGFNSEKVYIASTGPFTDDTENQKPKTLLHFHFTIWPDKGVPRNVTSVVEFRNKEQYEFIHDALAEALNAGRSTVPTEQFYSYYRDLMTNDKITGKSKLQEQYELLVKLTPSFDDKEFSTAKLKENRPETPVQQYQCRIYLQPLTSRNLENNYINAIFLPTRTEEKIGRGKAKSIVITSYIFLLIIYAVFKLFMLSKQKIKCYIMFQYKCNFSKAIFKETFSGIIVNIVKSFRNLKDT
ncbi:hypothetical protein KUTeg_017094 [Tegillarca granosa]|uniref:Tyrosine-protein phosphatase domain-containing protein n=1 Tax=Tegillarca granosa TaxID=220873 RepID=A0ABQ9EMW7_TEGGR|nr:hypothetical protein KUTeg_017094 [Tegillarca granosa]